MQRYIWFFFGVLWSVMTHAQVRFHTKLEAEKVLAGTPFTVTFELQNASGSQFHPPDFAPLQVLSGPSRMNTVNIINGSRSSSSSYSYEMVGYKPGKYLIGKASIRVRGKRMETRPITIQILKASPSSKDGKGNEKPFLIQMEIDSGNYFVGQQIILSIKLLTRTKILEYDVNFNPDFTDAYIEKLHTQLHKKMEIVNGREYASYVLERYTFYPQRAGKFTIPSAAVTVGIEDPSGSRRRSFFFDPPMKRTRMVTKPVELKVKDLPAGAPSSFAGAVGHYTAKFYVNHRRLTTDDALKLTLQLTGDGDMKVNEAPNQEFGENFDVYDPVLKNERVLPSENRIRFQKIYEYAVIPKEPGSYRIVPAFSYFNPDSLSYQSIYGDTIVLQIGKGVNGRHGLLTEETNLLNLHDIHYEPVLHKSRFLLFASPVYWGILLLTLLWIAWLYVRDRIRRKQAAIDPEERKKQHALAISHKHLKEAIGLEKAGGNPYFKAVQNGILSYLRNKLGIRTSQLNKSNIRQVLKAYGIPDNLIKETLNIITDCDTALYAPNLYRDREESLLHRASSLIASFEDVLAKHN